MTIPRPPVPRHDLDVAVPPAVAVAVAVAVPIVALCLAPALQFRHWPWIALALAAPVVLGLGAPVHRAAGAALLRGDVGFALLASAAPLAALGWSVHGLVVGEAGVPGFTQWAGGPRPVILDVAVVLILLALLRARGCGPGPFATVWTSLVLGVGAAVLGFGLGSGDGGTAAARATAVLVAGAPYAVLSAAAPPRRGGSAASGTRPPGALAVAAVHPLADADADADVGEVRRLAAALHAEHLPHPLAAAVVADSGALPGVSDADGTPETGLRGVVSELRGGTVVVAHAVLVGPADWLLAHGVAPPAQTGLFVAWDGVVRGRFDLVDLQARADRSARRTRVGVAAAAAAVGVALAAAGALDPATAVVVPLGATALVACHAAARTRIRRPTHGHPIGDTPG